MYVSNEARHRLIPVAFVPANSNSSSVIACNWRALRAQLLQQWNRLTAGEIDRAGPNRHRIALLIERKYGVGWEMVENYLRNFERTLPMASH